MSDLLSVKHDFSEMYNHPTCVKYYHQILHKMKLVNRLEILAKYSEVYLVPIFRKWAESLGKPLKCAEIFSAYGNDMLAVTNCFYASDFKKMWASEETCFTLSKPRQFPVKTWATDLSENACAFGVKAGIFDDSLPMNLNEMTPHQKAVLKEKCQTANILMMNSFSYAEDGMLEQILEWFESGKEPGMLVLGFTFPYDGVDRMKSWKSLLLKKFDFFNNVPSFNRLLDENEQVKFGVEYGTWDMSYYENWFLTRRV